MTSIQRITAISNDNAINRLTDSTQQRHEGHGPSTSRSTFCSRSLKPPIAAVLPGPTGIIIRPPTASCSSSASGIASARPPPGSRRRARAAASRRAVAVAEEHVADAEVLQSLLRALQQRLDPLDRVERRDQRRQNRRLVAATRTDFEHVAQRPALEHASSCAPRYRAGKSSARSRSATPCPRRRGSRAPRRRRCGAARANALEHLDRDALLAQALDQPVARARRGHADAGEARRSVTTAARRASRAPGSAA